MRKMRNVESLEDFAERKRLEEEVQRLNRQIEVLGAELKNTQRRLREGEERYRTLVERMPAVTIVQEIGSSDSALYISPQMETLTGYSLEECKDPDLRYEMVHLDDREWIQAEDDRTYEPDEWIVTEYRVLHRDGRVLWVRNSSTIVEDEASGSRYWQGFMVDITERKEAEEALRKSEEKYRSVVDNAREVIFQTDAQGLWTFLNPAWTEITGFPVEESIGTNFLDYVHPDDRQRNLDMFRPLLEHKKDYCRYEVRCLTRDGDFRWIEVRARSTLSDDGATIIGASGTLNDVTERKRAEEELREQQNFLRQVLDTNPSLIFVKDSKGRFTLVNKAMADVYGTTVEELIGRYDAAFSSNQEAVEARIRADREVMDTLQSKLVPEEAVTDLRTGEARYFQVIKVPIVSPDGVSRRVLGVATNITERKQIEERLKHQALHDPLTGLPNRVLFADRLKHALARIERQESRIAVLFVDLDNFKVVNDSLGHEAGDLLLTRLGQRLAAHLRAEDTLVRFGGDEFAVLLEDVAEGSRAALVAERITEELRAPFILGDREIVLSASIGVVLYTAGLEDPALLLRAADMALYRAKSRGKSRYEMFNQAMNTQALERLDLEADLRQAIEREELVIHYQPKVQLATGRIIGTEALLRWEHPERGLVSPDNFIPVAEETQLIRPIGRWVLREACRQAREWQEGRSSGPPLLMSVNLSLEQLQHPRLIDEVAQTLEETGVNPGALVLEITESMVMKDAESSIATLRRLKALGVRLALDDFGTGYSSLAYLKRFPIDMIKIDRSFVGGLGQDPEDTAIVRAIIGLAGALDLEVVAEGVETAEQMSRSQDLGCELGQGYYFAKPLPSVEVGELLRQDPT